MITEIQCVDCDAKDYVEHFNGTPRTRCIPCRDERESALHREQTQAWRIRTKAAREVKFNDEGAGMVYLAGSKWMPGIVKIGRTTANRGAENRLAVSSIPEPEIFWTWREDPPWALETRLHAHFDSTRIRGTEWFQVDPQEVIKIVESWMQ